MIASYDTPNVLLLCTKHMYCVVHVASTTVPAQPRQDKLGYHQHDARVVIPHKRSALQRYQRNQNFSYSSNGIRSMSAKTQH